MSVQPNRTSRRDFLQDLTVLGGAGVGGSLLLSACSGQSGQEEEGASSDSDGQAVKQIHQIRWEWERAENEGDPGIIDRHATDDVLSMPPGEPPVVGAEADKEHLREWFDQFDIEIEYTSDEVVVSGDLAFDRGIASHRRVPKKGGDPIEGTASYLWVYRRTSEGWKQIRAIWNQNR